MYIPDNYSIYEAYEAEQERLERRRRRREIEAELKFITVPDNYYEAEQERIKRMRKRKQREFEKEEYGWQHYTNLPDNIENY